MRETSYLKYQKLLSQKNLPGQTPQKEVYLMKWGKYPEKFAAKFLGPKGIFILLSLAALLLLSGATDKWGG